MATLSQASILQDTLAGTTAEFQRAGLIPGTELESPDVALFIEGIQVPFISIILQEVAGELPTMTVELPYHPLFMKLDESYLPQVHLFVTQSTAGLPVTAENSFLKFAGVIVATDSSKTYNNANLTLQCVHRFVRLKEVLLQYSGNTNMFGADQTDVTASQAAFNHQMAAVDAYQGLSLTSSASGVTAQTTAAANVTTGTSSATGSAAYIQTISSVSPANSGLVNTQWAGMPSILINYWNQLKFASYTFQNKAAGGTAAQAMTGCYIPLIESGLQFFRGLSGHSYLEQLSAQLTTILCGDQMVIPSTRQGFVISGASKQAASSFAQSAAEYSMDVSTLWDTYQQVFLTSADYNIDIITMPAKNPQGNFIESIVHPIAPLYYSPSCNIVFANSLVSLTLGQQSYAAPTRLTASANLSAGISNSATTYLTIRSPQSVRVALANAYPGAGVSSTGTQTPSQAATPASPTTNTPTLYDSLNNANEALGTHEYGSGSRPMKYQIPNWLIMAYQTGISTESETGTPSAPSAATTQSNFAELGNLEQSMKTLYDTLYPVPPGVSSVSWERFNPWSFANNGLAQSPAGNFLMASLMTFVDYMFGMLVLSTKTATVQCLFHPGMVAGYPMDVMDSSPYGESVHGLAAAITHSITPHAVSTTVSLTNVFTYDKMGKFYAPPMPPWLTYILGFTSTPSLINNPTAKAIADQIYAPELGCISVSPDSLYDFESQAPKDTGNVSPLQAQYATSRPTMTRADYEQQFNIKFITLDMQNSSITNIAVPVEKPTEGGAYMEFGESPYLSYNELNSIYPGVTV